MDMRVKIKKCSDPLYWYHGFIGREFTVLWIDESGYWTREPSGYTNVIKDTDAEEINNEYQ